MHFTGRGLTRDFESKALVLSFSHTRGFIDRKSQ